MEKTEIRKELYKSKVMAKFSHYSYGNLYYTVELEEGKYQFPIEVVEKTTEYFLPENPGEDEVEFDHILLSSDLGTTSFYTEIIGSELGRWIVKAIDKEEFIKIG